MKILSALILIALSFSASADYNDQITDVFSQSLTLLDQAKSLSAGSGDHCSQEGQLAASAVELSRYILKNSPHWVRLAQDSRLHDLNRCAHALSTFPVSRPCDALHASMPSLVSKLQKLADQLGVDVSYAVGF